VKFFKVLVAALFKVFILFFTILIVAKNPILQTSITSLNNTIRANSVYLKNHVEFLSNVKPPRSEANLDSLNVIANYISNVWKNQGLEVSEQLFVKNNKTFKNIIVSLGNMNSNERIVVGAHYDVYNEFPGADDNASGVAGLLELTRIIKDSSVKLNKRIDFVAFSLEEPPSFSSNDMGSFHHAKMLSDQNVHVSLMISLEMIGYYGEEENSQKYPLSFFKFMYPDKGNFIAIIGDLNNYFTVRKLKKLMDVPNKTEVYSMNAPGFVTGVDFSDHRNYWLFKFPAVMITDTSFYRNFNYHTKEDTSEKLNYERMADVINNLSNAIQEY